MIVSRILEWLKGFFSERPKYKVSINPSAVFKVQAGSVLDGSTISLGKNACLYIAEGCRVDAVIRVDHNCSVRIAENCEIGNTSLTVGNGATVEIEQGVRLGPPDSLSSDIVVVVDDGALVIGAFSRIQSDIMVRFGGLMTIGKYVGIGYSGDIRCEDRLEIGDYVLISYEVCIYDTNTHSCDWKKRRETIERIYWKGVGEIEKPETQPIVIGSDTWIGRGAVVLKGSKIGDRSIIGIHTTVSGEYNSDSVIVSASPRVLSFSDRSS